MAQEYAWTDSEIQTYGSLLMGLFYAGYGVANRAGLITRTSLKDFSVRRRR